MECSKCGALNVRLFDVITGEGIIKLCQYCLSEEDAPVIKKPTVSQFQSVNKNLSVYDRLSKSVGLNASEHKKNIFGSQQQEQLKQQEGTLRDLVDQRFDRVKEKPKKREDLIDNFHWVIMRARRSKKMTLTQFAMEIGESEKVVKMAEQGILPEGDNSIVKKIETILAIRIFKPEFAQKAEHKKQLGFDEFTAKTLTISDLQEMKKEVAEVQHEKEPYWKRLMNALTGKKTSEIKVKEEIKEEQTSEEEVELGSLRETPIEFNDTTLEISDDIKYEKEIDDEIRKGSQGKKDLSTKDIDDILFGKNNKE